MKDLSNRSKIAIAIGLTLVMVLSGATFLATSNAGFKPSSVANSYTASSSNNSTLYLTGGPSPAYVDNFNPFNIWSEPTGIMGMMFEPLLQINTYNGTVIPWLATGYTFSKGGLYLNMTLRHNVTYTNGQPFNAYDVQYVFNLEKSVIGEWGAVRYINATGPYSVSFKFYSPTTNYLFYIGCNAMFPTNQTWEKTTNSNGVLVPQSAIVTNPIGTGPYMIQSFSPQKIVLVRNPHYWQPGLPKMGRLVYNDYTSGNAATLALAEGKLDWASCFAPNLTQLFVANNPKYNHYWFPSGQTVTLMVNDLAPFLNSSYVRQAMSMAINRTAICQIGEYGFEKPANAAMLLKQQMNELNSGNLKQATSLATYNVSAALSLLESHGFKMSSSGKLEYSNGTLVPSISLMSVSGYADWDTDITIIASELKAIGLTVTTTTPTGSVLASDISTGSYQLALDTVSGIGPNAWYDYGGMVGSVTPVGKTAYVNEERWNVSSTFMSAFNNFTLTGNTTLQRNYENVMASQWMNSMPVISLVYSGDWFEYVNSSIGGWPSAANPYWIPMPWYPHPAEFVVLHLYPLTTSHSSPAGISALTYDFIGIVLVAAVAGALAFTYVRKKKKMQSNE